MEHQPEITDSIWRRLGVLAGFLAAILVLTTVLSQPAAASSPGNQPRPVPPHLFMAAEADEEEVEEDESEWAEESEGEGEEAEEEGEANAERPHGVPPECLEYTVAARIVISAPHRTVRLTVHYDSYEAGRAKLAYWLKGRRGSLKLGSATWHVSRQGSLTRTAHIDERELAKAEAARVYVVQVEMPGTPSYCELYCTRHLTQTHRNGGRTVWTERPSGTQPLRRPAAAKANPPLGRSKGR